MSVRKTSKSGKVGRTSMPSVRKAAKRQPARGKAAESLPRSMISGKASAAWMRQVSAVPGVGGKKR